MDAAANIVNNTAAAMTTGPWGQTLLFVLLLLGLAGVVGAWLVGPPWRVAWRRARIRRQPFPAAWRALLRQQWPLYSRLPTETQLRLKKHVQVLLAEVPFIGCGGLTVTDEVRVLVAAQAALLLVGRRAGAFGVLRQVLVYPGHFVVQRNVADGAGLVRDERQTLAGESWQHGQVVLAWDEVRAGAAVADDGRNVVVHEFAHQLDQEGGAANGAPWLPGRARAARWAAVMRNEFDALQQRLARGEAGVLDPYAATNPAEFFAVASEVFFERPQALALAHPALYAELRGLYRLDPLHW